MRKIILVPVLASLAACGSSSHGGSDPCAAAALSATLDGHALSAADLHVAGVKAVTTTTCPALGALPPFNVSALAFDFASYAGVCADVATLPTTCTSHKGAQNAFVLLALVGGTSAPPLTPGTTYTFKADVTDAALQNGTPAVVFGESFATDATSCSATGVPTSGGTLTICSVSDTQVTGVIDATFHAGSSRTDTLKGSFTAPLNCGVSLDPCALAQTAFASGVCSAAPGSCL